MLGFFSSLVRFFQHKHSKTLLVIVGIMLVGACFGATSSGETPQYTESDITKGIIEIFDLIFGLLALVLGPMVVLCGWLLSPDWTMGDFFGLRVYFQEVWVLVANIVYIIFALMLLFMAIMQIFGGDESQYAFKKKLPRFLVGILIVPFTWLIVSWTLSFANQAVAAVLSIPMGSMSKLSTGGVPGKQDTSMWHKKVLPTEFDFSTTGESGYGKGIKCENGATSKGVKCISPAEFLTYNQAGPFFIIMIYAYNIFKIQEADIAPLKNFCRGDGAGGNTDKYTSASGCVQNLMGIVRDFGLALIVTVFFGIMLIALCWVLLMRAIKLWIYIMLSPLFGLAFFTGEGLGTPVGEAGESGFGQVGFMAFFKLAMVPVIVSAVLAFGLLFVGVVRDNFHGNIKDPNQKEFCTKQGVGYMVTYCITEVDGGAEGPTYLSKLIIGTDVRQGDKSSLITLNFGNSFSKIIGGAEASSVAAGAVSGGISSVEDIFAHLILTMMALVFMFIGVKAAVQYDEVTKAAFAPFAKLGESVGTFVAHSPSYLPLPHPAFGMITNPNIATGIVDALRTKYDEKAAAPGKAAAEIFSNSSLRNLDTKTADELNKLSSRNGSSQAIFNEQKRRLDQIIQSLPQGPERDKLERDLRQANTVKEQSILKDIAGTLKSMNEKGDKKFLDKEGTTFTNGMATVTTSDEIRQRFDKGNQTYDNGGGSPISLKPSNWKGVAPQHSDLEFRRNNKDAFVAAGITSVDDISDKNIAKIREELAKSTNNAINFNDWKDEELKNLYKDSQQASNGGH